MNRSCCVHFSSELLQVGFIMFCYFSVAPDFLAKSSTRPHNICRTNLCSRNPALHFAERLILTGVDNTITKWSVNSLESGIFDPGCLENHQFGASPHPIIPTLPEELDVDGERVRNYETTSTIKMHLCSKNSKVVPTLDIDSPTSTIIFFTESCPLNP